MKIMWETECKVFTWHMILDQKYKLLMQERLNKATRISFRKWNFLTNTSQNAEGKLFDWIIYCFLLFPVYEWNQF